MRYLNYWDNKNFWGAKSGPLTHASSVKFIQKYVRILKADIWLVLHLRPKNLIQYVWISKYDTTTTTVVHFQVLTTLFQSTYFTYFTCKRLVIWTTGSFPVILLTKKCSFDVKSYVFLKLCSNMKSFWSENSFFTGFDIKKSRLWLDIFCVSPYKKPFSDLYLSIFEHHLENK